MNTSEYPDPWWPELERHDFDCLRGMHKGKEFPLIEHTSENCHAVLRVCDYCRCMFLAEWTDKREVGDMKNKTKGVTVVEYAIMLALIAIAVMVATPSISSAVVRVFSRASSVMGN